jgi:hypothetical protein
MKTLEDKWLAAKTEYDRAKRDHGPRSIHAAMALRELNNITARILKRDNRRRKA